MILRKNRKEKNVIEQVMRAEILRLTLCKKRLEKIWSLVRK